MGLQGMLHVGMVHHVLAEWILSTLHVLCSFPWMLTLQSRHNLWSSADR